MTMTPYVGQQIRYTGRRREISKTEIFTILEIERDEYIWMKTADGRHRCLTISDQRFTPATKIRRH